MYLIVGENTYLVQQELQRLLQDVPAQLVERYAGETITEPLLSDIMRGTTLFASERTVIIKDLSLNKDSWELFARWVPEVPSSTMLVIIEQKLDKRTKTYKDLSKQLKVIAADYWTDRDEARAEQWLAALAREQDLSLSTDQIKDMVKRAEIPAERPGQFFIDQMQLVQAMQSLSVLDEMSDESIAAVMPPPVSETIYRLLEHATKRDRKDVDRILGELHEQQDPHLAFASVAKQWSQLVMVALSGHDATTLPIHPYVLTKLRTQAREISHSDLTQLTRLAADLDARLKNSEVSAWQAFDRFMMAITLR